MISSLKLGRLKKIGKSMGVCARRRKGKKKSGDDDLGSRR